MKIYQYGRVFIQLEQMELEARESRDRQRNLAKIKTYESELKKLEKDLVSLIFLLHFSGKIYIYTCT